MLDTVEGTEESDIEPAHEEFANLISPGTAEA